METPLIKITELDDQRIVEVAGPALDLLREVVLQNAKIIAVNEQIVRTLTNAVRTE